ncbi:hypothetical protein HK407_02g03160 [Ordospora pajunii]|uniref:uncharacterized protein n=1 Tax=Ordospora pajunii TaxID=3039483 RepID=UPI0029526A94|nr:uncharacterized protein HK407_02g03160 [Ordospora pajunii]KAH9412092.1 hypothetical protein HK407_02g03160 [Ordospora pajunii]
MKILLLLPFVSMQAINLVLLYEKPGIKEARDMYRYVVERMLDKFNAHFHQYGTKINLLDFMAYDDYLTKPEYQSISITGGDESLDTRIEALKDIPANVILVASASPDEEHEKYVSESPCTSRFVSNMVSSDVLEDEMFTKIVYATLSWMRSFFGMDVPNPIKEKNPDVFDKFARDVNTNEFMKMLKQCSRDASERFEVFSRALNWNSQKGFAIDVEAIDAAKEKGIEISSPLKLESKPEGKQQSLSSKGISVIGGGIGGQNNVEPFANEEEQYYREDSVHNLNRAADWNLDMNVNGMIDGKQLVWISKGGVDSDMGSEISVSNSPGGVHANRLLEKPERVFHRVDAKGQEIESEEALIDEKIRNELQRIMQQEADKTNRQKPDVVVIPKKTTHVIKTEEGPSARLFFARRAVPLRDGLSAGRRSTDQGRIAYRRPKP